MAMARRIAPAAIVVFLALVVASVSVCSLRWGRTDLDATASGGVLPAPPSVPATSAIAITLPRDGTRVAARTRVLVSVSVSPRIGIADMWLSIQGKKRLLTKGIPHVAMLEPLEAGNYVLICGARDAQGNILASKPVLLVALEQPPQRSRPLWRHPPTYRMYSASDLRPHFYVVVVDSAPAGYPGEEDRDIGKLFERGSGLREDGWSAEVFATRRWNGLTDGYEALIAGRYPTLAEAREAATRFKRRYPLANPRAIGPVRGRVI